MTFFQFCINFVRWKVKAPENASDIFIDWLIRRMINWQLVLCLLSLDFFPAKFSYKNDLLVNFG